MINVIQELPVSAQAMSKKTDGDELIAKEIL